MSTYIKQMLGPYMLNKYLDTFMFKICILCMSNATRVKYVY